MKMHSNQPTDQQSNERKADSMPAPVQTQPTIPSADLDTYNAETDRIRQQQMQRAREDHANTCATERTTQLVAMGFVLLTLGYGLSSNNGSEYGVSILAATLFVISACRVRRSQAKLEAALTPPANDAA